MIKLDELVDIVPNFFIRRMEDMGPVAMDADPLFFFAVDVTTDVRSPFQDQALAPGFFISWAKTTPKRPLPTMT